MRAQMNPQEIYLLERYISLDYFAELRDTWEEMVNHVDSCLSSFMRSLPSNYRSRSLPEQPDIVWGQRVLPNFRDTLQGLNTGFVLLTHGEYKGLSYAWGPPSDFKGQMDYWAGWMAKRDEDLYEELLGRAVRLARNICWTEDAGWDPSDLSNYSDSWGPLNPPAHWPLYRINKDVSVRSGEELKQSGIYVPNVENSCAQFLRTNGRPAPSAKVLIGTKDLVASDGVKYAEEKILEKRSCLWYLVERTPDSELSAQPQTMETTEARRVVGGAICPETGFYFTPARSDSRRVFRQGEVMPDFDAAFGMTIWQWDSHQS